MGPPSPALFTSGVDLAEGLETLGDQAAHVVLDGRVADHGDGLAAGLLDLLGGFLHEIRRAGRAHDARPLAGETQAQRAPDALGRAGDDRHFPVEQPHPRLLTVGVTAAGRARRRRQQPLCGRRDSRAPTAAALPDECTVVLTDREACGRAGWWTSRPGRGHRRRGKLLDSAVGGAVREGAADPHGGAIAR